MKIIKTISSQIFLSLVLTISAYAQKQPTVQKVGKSLPGNVKVDGIPSEFNNKYEAYNPSTNLFYTMANSEHMLYLAVHVEDQFAMQKLLQGGLTLTVFDKQTNDGAVSITFPMLSQAVAGGVMSRVKDPSYGTPERLLLINNELTGSTKEIKISGVKEIPDTLISEFNEYNIKAVVAFGSDQALTYELCIPLKYLKDQINNSKQFKYNIKLNGIEKSMDLMVGDRKIDPNSAEGRQIMAELSDPSRQNIVGVAGGSGRMTKATGSFAELLSPTDFTGVYALVN
jgi:hypothetical protein